MQCPCGSNISFKQCCFLIINKDVRALSPEKLMRSRYSAYATKAVDYIYNTYANSSQKSQSKSEISAWVEETKWLKLIVNSVSDYPINEKEYNSVILTKEESYPTVLFSAYYQHQGSYFLMKENSRFVLENNLWRYLDGDVNESEQLEIPNRNELCFCQSQKKFKRCCGA
jgi:SEC-C motif-containing protein